MKLPSICLFSVVILSVQSAPIDAPSPKLVYDQKQTGEYNIQVHLKDLQIVALLGDDALGVSLTDRSKPVLILYRTTTTTTTTPTSPSNHPRETSP
jgi:hypothetical protein